MTFFFKSHYAPSINIPDTNTPDSKSSNYLLYVVQSDILNANYK